MAKWQLHTGLRVSELLRLAVVDTQRRSDITRSPENSYRMVKILRKGRKPGEVIASASLLEQTSGYTSLHRRAWLQRGARKGRRSDWPQLFVSNRGTPVKKNTYQRMMGRVSVACGFRVTSHALRATFACLTLATLEKLAKQGAAINPLLIVKVLMGHEHIETTDRYLRSITLDTCVLTEVLDSLNRTSG